ncbi:MAG: sortase [Candidatus Kaiserbacteria bacterium]|nr:sortase [Candidatus Kaiserbacteria bacterium]
MYTKRIIGLTVRFIRAGKLAYTKKWSFLVLSFCVFFLNVLMLGKLDLLPQAIPVKASSPEVLVAAKKVVATSTPVVLLSELPVKIEIPAIKLSTSIANPVSTVIATLDQELLKGAVRYPTSAKLGETGNIVLFGHSSYLPVVLNEAYKAFNDIQKLKAGDTVIVYSSDTAYTYEVRTVEKESTNNAGIPLSVTGRVLTLSTCDSFGAKSDRFVVTADFVESHSIAT